MLDDSGLLGKKDSAAEVNMAPLLDMVFILLIFFVITTNFNRQTGVEVQKPKAESAVYQGAKTVMIGVSREGSIHIHGRQVSVEQLSNILTQELNRRPDASVVIIGDQKSVLGRTVEVLDACLTAGFEKVSIAADKE